MTITKIDLVSLAVIIFFAFRGYKKGAIGTLINLVGLIASFVISWYLSPWLTEKLMGFSLVQSLLQAWLGTSATDQTVLLEATTKMLTLLVFAAIFVVLMVLVKKIKKKLEEADKIPIVGSANKLLGAVLGIVTAALGNTFVIGGLYYFAGIIGNTDLQSTLLESSFLSLFLMIVK